MKVDKQKVEDWKKQHGEIFQIETGGKSCIIRKPTRKDLSYVSVVKDPIKMQETLLKQLWLDGDEEILTDDDLFFAACSQLEEVLKVKEAEIKKTLEDAGIEDVDASSILYIDILLRYNLCLDPDTLPDEQWAWTIRYLKDIKIAENRTDG